jgi:hypothetical protein
VSHGARFVVTLSKDSENSDVKSDVIAQFFLVKPPPSQGRCTGSPDVALPTGKRARKCVVTIRDQITVN